MGNNRPLPTKCVENFLTSKGFQKTRTAGSHDQWTRKNSRTIPVWGNSKEIPAMHLRCNCRTMGVTMEQLYAWAKENC